MSNAVHAVSALDEAIKEYLLFRGFTHTLRAFEGEVRNDRDRGLKVDKIVNQLFTYVASSDLNGLCDFWDHLRRRFFSRLEKSFTASVRKLDLCVKRYYVVHAVQNGKQDRVNEFFDRMTHELRAYPEWRDWFILPFVKNPETHPTFETFFTRAWLETFTLSLHNFLNTVFHNLPLPTLLSFHDDQIRLRMMTEEVESLRASVWQDHNRKTVRGSGGAQGADDGGGVGTPGVASTTVLAGSGGVLPPPYDPYPAPPPPPPPADTSDGAADAMDATLGTSGVATAQDVDGSTATPSDSAQEANDAPTDTEDSAGDAPSSTDGGPNEDAEGADAGTSVSEVLPAGDPAEPQKVFMVLNQERYGEHTAPITRCSVSAQGTYVATADVAGILKIWCISPVLKTTKTLALGTRLTALAWDPDSDSSLFLGYADGGVERVDVDTDRTVDGRVPASHPRVVALACKGSVLACGVASEGGEGTPASGLLHLLNATTLQVQASLSAHQFKSAVASSFHFNHNTTLLVVGCEDGMVQIFDVRSNTFIMRWQAHKARICSVKFSQDETTVFSSSADGTIMRWNAHHLGTPVSQSPEAPVVLDVAADFARASEFAFDTEDDYVLRNCSTAADGEACIFQLRHRQVDAHVGPVLRLRGHDAAVTCLDWCTTTNTCFTGSTDNTVCVYTLFRVT
eukprot:m.161627 g.161627  ORF g.161627 m.161627 type:complete len:680 (-) comp18051_c0_seq1:209-2248(-)